jgi:hypothetical protein
VWEIAWYLAQGNPAKAFRRLRRGGVTARFSESASVRVHYPSIHRLRRIFTPEFRLVSFKGIGVSVPPSYMEYWANRFPRLFDLSIRADLFLEHCPGMRAFADHILLEFRRENLQLECG